MKRRGGIWLTKGVLLVLNIPTFHEKWVCSGVFIFRVKMQQSPDFIGVECCLEARDMKDNIPTFHEKWVCWVLKKVPR